VGIVQGKVAQQKWTLRAVFTAQVDPAEQPIGESRSLQHQHDNETGSLARYLTRIRIEPTASFCRPIRRLSRSQRLFYLCSVWSCCQSWCRRHLVNLIADTVDRQPLGWQGLNKYCTCGLKAAPRAGLRDANISSNGAQLHPVPTSAIEIMLDDYYKSSDETP
jgi:hypothetical protein